MSSPPVSSVRTWLIGADPRQQLRVSQALLVLLMTLAFAGVQHAEVVLGMVDFDHSWPLTVFSIGSAVVCYGLLRSGWNLRLQHDRAMAVPQTLWTVISLTWSYAITGPARGAILLIMASVIMFGMFSLSPRQQAALAGLAFGLLGCVMAFKAWTDPARYDPRVEAMHFLFAGIVIAAAVVLSIRIGRLRSGLQDQKHELQAALERIQTLATRDELTGLLNRRAAMEWLRVELRRRDHGPLALALIDLDHFKRINDTHGHAAGDAALRRFADEAGAEVRGGDVLARWGGEEFLLMMPGTDAVRALACLTRIRSRLHALPLHDIAAGLVLSFSAGLATCFDEPDIESAIERADALMYAAKMAGRDRALGPDAAPRLECATLAN